MSDIDIVNEIDQKVVPLITIKKNNITLKGKDHKIQHLEKQQNNQKKFLSLHLQAPAGNLELIARIECVRNRNSYVITIYRTQNLDQSYTVRSDEKLYIEATLLQGGGIDPESGTFTLAEICEALDLWEISDVFSHTKLLLDHIDIIDHRVVLNRKPAASKYKKLLYTTIKALNQISYRIAIYKLNQDDIIIEAQGVYTKRFPLQPLYTTIYELGEVIDMEPQNVLSYLDNVADMLWVDGEQLEFIKSTALNGSYHININPVDANEGQQSPIKVIAFERSFSNESIQRSFSNELLPQKEVEAIVKLQCFYRKYIAIRTVQLMQASKMRQGARMLLLRKGRMLNGLPFLISIFQQDEGYLIEARNCINDLHHTKFIINPSSYVFGFQQTRNWKLIVDAIRFTKNGLAFSKINKQEQGLFLNPAVIDLASDMNYSYFDQEQVQQEATPEESLQKDYDLLIYGSDTQELVLQKKKTIQSKQEKFLISIYKEHDGYFIELCSLEQPELDTEIASMRFMLDELKNIYGYDISPELLYEDAEIEDGELILKREKVVNQLIPADNKRPELTSEFEESVPNDPYYKYYEDYVITQEFKEFDGKHASIVASIRKKMRENMKTLMDDDVILFEVVQPQAIVHTKWVSLTIARASAIVGMEKDYLYPISRYIIHHMLEVNNFAATINYQVPKIDVVKFVVFIQSHIRGYLVRYKYEGKIYLKRTTLITLVQRKFKDDPAIVYAYRSQTRIRLEVNFYDRSQLALYLDADYIEDYRKNLTQKQFLEQMIIPSLYISQEHAFKRLCLPHKMDFQQQIAPLETSPTQNSLSQASKIENDALHTSNESQPPIAPKKKLLARQGKVISGRYFQISIYRRKYGCAIHALDVKLQKTLKLKVKFNVFEIDDSYLANLVEDLIPRLSLARNSANKIKLLLKDKGTPDNILYKTSCYLDNRYFIATVYSQRSNLKVVAHEPETGQELELVIGSISKNHEDLEQSDFEELVNGLRVQSVLGKQVLIFVGNQLILTNLWDQMLSFQEA